MRDETGKISAGRLLLFAWTPFTAAILWTEKPLHVVQAAVAVELYLVTWNAGPRMAAYLGPQISAAVGAIKQVIAKRRANGETEDTP